VTTSRAAFSVALLLAIASAGCASTPEASTTEQRRLPDERICELFADEDVANALDMTLAADGTSRPPDGRRCSFSFESARPLDAKGVAITYASEQASGETSSIEIDGFSATQLEEQEFCSVDVWLVADDINQEFNVYGDTCEEVTKVARLVLSKLPD
jgi:hypothetical protein